MKRFVALATASVVSVLMLIGCSNNDGPSGPANDYYIGIWEIDFSVVGTSGTDTTYLHETLTLNSNSTFSSRVTHTNGDLEYLSSGSYSVTADEIDFTISNIEEASEFFVEEAGDTYYGLYAVNETNLVLIYSSGQYRYTRSAADVGY